MDNCSASKLLLPDAHGRFAGALLRYPPLYDEPLAEIHARLVAIGERTKSIKGHSYSRSTFERPVERESAIGWPAC